MRKLLIILMILSAGCAKRQMLSPEQAQLTVMDQVMQAAMLEQDGQSRQAIKLYKSSLRLDKGSALLNLLISQNYYQLGNDTLAILYARRAVRLEPGNPDNRLMLGNAYMMARELELSLEQYRAAVKLKPDNPDISITTAGLYEALGRRDSAITVMENIVRQTSDPNIAMQLGSMLMRDKQSEPAKEIYRQIIGRDSSNIRAWISLAAIYEVGQQPDSALYFYGTAARLDPENLSIQKHIFNLLLSLNQYQWAARQAMIILEREPGNAGLRLQLARLFYHQQAFQPAKEQFLAVLESDSNNTEALYTVARISFQQKDYPPALRYFQRTIGLLPKMAEGWVALGNCFLALGQPDSAAASYRNARRYGLKQDLDQLMGAGYSLSEKYREAIPFFQNQYRKEPKDPDLMFGLAVAYERSGGFDNAVTMFKKLLELNPKSAIVLNYLGYMYADKGINLEEAKDLIAKALEAEPENAFYIDSMGWVFYKMDRFEEAKESLEKAVGLLPKDATLRDHLGDVYLSLNLKQQAIEQWQKSLELDPGKEKIQEKIDAAR
ncbi:MAG: tetratricopeptide repeat protein [Candidatus Edwardsbacteria bacterium]|nr:tetratricopeptide repeat protein [Candidatus Edwardsbacteria bacterium]MBU1576814.1 tetratricopeptide repeat protein [Candidatus Edwardsbacteria bacterium]MBU2463905.1 tetratricopeptide repeat protein [Candidatus Edwardsbacteria bacterium]MBU2593329.1 tetratricopeptide repeat protein [Candidatus Edwardsbacteria bacterium]